MVGADPGMSTSLRQHMRPHMSSSAVPHMRMSAQQSMTQSAALLMRQRMLRNAQQCKIQNMRLNMKVSALQHTRLFVLVMVEEEVDTMMNNCLLMSGVEKGEKEMEDLMQEERLEVDPLALDMLLP